MDRIQASRYLGEEKISKLMFKFTMPCLFSLLVSSLYNIVDQIFIGNSELSTLGNAATGVVFPMFIIAQSFAWCVGDGCAAYLNICQGRNDWSKAPKALGTGITVSFFISLILIAVFYPIKVPVLMLFGASENSIGMAVEYFDIILAFFPAYILSNMLMSSIRADGSPGYSMISVTSGAVVNIILDPIFIFGFKWGMTGAAAATVIGQCVSLIAAGLYFLKPKTFTLTLRDLIPDFGAFWDSLKLGFSTFIIQITILVVTIVCNMMLKKYGAMSQFGVDIPIAVIGIINKVFVVVMNLVVAIVLGCQPIASYNMGAGKYHRVKKLYLAITICGVAISAASTLIFELWPTKVIGLFGAPTNIPNPENYWIFAAKSLRIFLMFITFTSIIKINAIFFQAVGKPSLSIISSLTRDAVCFIPLTIILPQFFGLDGILYAAPLADLISLIVAIALAIPFIRTLDKKEHNM